MKAFVLATITLSLAGSSSAPAVAQDLYVGSSNTLIQRGNPTSGDFQVVGACGGQVSSMVADGQNLFIGDVSGRIYHYDGMSGALSYLFDAANDAAALVMDGNELLVGGTDGSVWRHEKSSGSALGVLQSLLPVPAMLRLGRTLYVGSPFGVIQSATLPNGEFSFFGSCGGPVGAMIQHDEEIILATPGSIYRIGLDDGAIHDTFGLGNDPTGLVLHQGMLLVSGTDGLLLRIDPWTGAVVQAPLDTQFDVQGMALNGLPAPGKAYCFGTNCPCGNADPSAGCANSTGSGALLLAFGTPSVVQDDLVLFATGMPANQFALFYMGASVIEIPFGDGKLCAGAGGYGNFRFLPVRKSGSTGSLALGPGIGWHATQHFGATGQISVGFTWNFQIWYRDGNGSPCGGAFNLSNAYATTFQP